MKWRINCKEAHQHMLTAQDRRLPLPARGALAVHVWICHNCKRFSQQLQLIRHALRKWDRQE